MKLQYSLTGVFFLLFLVACTLSEKPEIESEVKTVFKDAEVSAMNLSSFAFEDGGKIPLEYANSGIEGGENISIPLEWSNVPERAQSIAITMIDKHEIADDFVHWMILDFPVATTIIPAQASGSDELNSIARELNNDFGQQGYGGPQPPAGSGKHEYVITVYALDAVPLGLEGAVSEDAFLAAVESHILSSASISGFFGDE